MIRKKKYLGKTVFLAVNMHFTDRYSLLISTSGEFANIYILGFPLMIKIMINSTNTLISIIHIYSCPPCWSCNNQLFKVIILF